MASDDIRGMSEALAADPQSLVFLPLAEALLARGDLAHAARVASRGAAKHQQRAEAHDLVARIALAQGDETRAEAAWETVLALVAGHLNAHRGLGFIRYRQGRLDDAHRHLEAARAADPNDKSVLAALEAVDQAREEATMPTEHVAIPPRPLTPPPPPPAAVAPIAEVVVAAPAPRASAPVARPSLQIPAVEDIIDRAPHEVFDDIVGDSAQVALLLDADGLVTAGSYVTSDGTDLGMLIGAHLSGVSDEADRAMRHFGLGHWTRIVLETGVATVAMAPEAESLILLASPKETPLGFVRRTLERCALVARAWVGGNS